MPSRSGAQGKDTAMAGRKKTPKNERKSSASAYEEASDTQKAAAAEKASKPAPGVRKPKPATDKRGSAQSPIVPPGRGEITEPVPFNGMSGTRVSTVQEQPPHPRPSLHPGVVDNADATAKAHHVAVNTATAQSAHSAAIAAAQAGLLGGEAKGQANLPRLEAKGEADNLQPVSVDYGIPAEWGVEVASRPPAIPEQSPAPVRVEERGGRISLISNQDSALGATEVDFNAWREPVLDHILELLSGDFGPGTNHSRARDRLVALSTLLAGSIPDVKERQFHIGYQIERLDGLIVAYRSGIDDMPVLNAAVLEDLDRLRIALMMGIGKLERWSEFRHAVAADPLQEGSASPGVVGAAIDEMAAGMEAEPKYFDPALPRTFRFLAEGAKDPVGATRAVVFGAVKSVENVLVFLGQRALGIGKNAAGAVEQHISKAVTISLIVALSDAALRISGALPTEWTWLKPLLDFLAKGSGG